MRISESNSRPEVVVVTGACAGVGRAVARRFVHDGAHIGLIARGLDGLEGARNDVEVTYPGTVYGTQAALSALAYRAIPLQSAYCAAKHAIQGFTGSLRCELIHDKSNVHATMVHLTALNTPQFRWNKSRLPNHPQPVPPIYQPEVAAEAIHFAAHARRREMSVGLPTVIALYGNKAAPGSGDWYIGSQGRHSTRWSSA